MSADAPVRPDPLRPGPLRLGTRRSALARAQSEAVAQQLREASGREVVLVEVTTRGDVDGAPLRQIGGTGVFVTALREALLDDSVDLAVHSMKDLPTAAADGLVLAAVPPREDPRDVLVAAGGAGLGDLPRGARVGTGSPRRAAMLRALGLGLEVVDVRGNVDTRVAMVTSGRLDAVVLAAAGLRRLGREDEITEHLDVEQVLPAPAQGALALECRADDEETALACAALDDPLSRSATTAERALLGALEAGCSAPVGALARTDGGEGGGELVLHAAAASPDGSCVLRRSARGDDRDPLGLGRRLAADLLAGGAAELADVGPSAAGRLDAQPSLPGSAVPSSGPHPPDPGPGGPPPAVPDPVASTPAPSPALPPAGSPTSSAQPSQAAPPEDGRKSYVTAPTGPAAPARRTSSQESEA